MMRYQKLAPIHIAAITIFTGGIRAGSFNLSWNSGLIQIYTVPQSRHATMPPMPTVAAIRKSTGSAVD